jgi:hypothetical protein
LLDTARNAALFDGRIGSVLEGIVVSDSDSDSDSSRRKDGSLVSSSQGGGEVAFW